MQHVCIYSELDLRKLKGQAIKDVWHTMIGKPAGLKNVTGLHSLEEIIQAILGKQSEMGNCPSEEIVRTPVEVPMPPKVKPKEAKKKEVKHQKLLAIESPEEPLEVLEVVRIVVQKKNIDGHDYYVEKDSNKVYMIRTGEVLGTWNAESNSIQVA